MKMSTENKKRTQEKVKKQKRERGQKMQEIDYEKVREAFGELTEAMSTTTEWKLSNGIGTSMSSFCKALQEAMKPSEEMQKFSEAVKKLGFIGGKYIGEHNLTRIGGSVSAQLDVIRREKEERMN